MAAFMGTVSDCQPTLLPLETRTKLPPSCVTTSSKGSAVDLPEGGQELGAVVAIGTAYIAHILFGHACNCSEVQTWLLSPALPIETLPKFHNAKLHGTVN